MQDYIYVILTQTGSLPSLLFQAVLGTPYNHASVSLDRELVHMYSFGRKWLYFPFIGGLLHEQPDRHMFRRFRSTTCCVIAIPVSRKTHLRAGYIIEEFLREADAYGYDLLGVAARGLGIRWERCNHYICSQFVAAVLRRSGAWDLGGRDEFFCYPCDFLGIPGASVLYEGRLRDYRGADVPRTAAAAHSGVR